MLKLKLQTDQGTLMVLGLSAMNITRLQTGMPIKFDLAPFGFEGSMMLYAGDTEATMIDELVQAKMVDAQMAARMKHLVQAEDGLEAVRTGQA